MRTLEEVRKHLSEVVYNDMEDRKFIIGFLMGQGIWQNWDKPMDFAEYEEHDLTDFFAWWDKAEEEDVEEEKYSFESWVHSVIKDAGNMKFSRFILEDETKEVREALEQLNNETKERGKKCIAEMDAALKELEGLVNCTTNPRLQKVGSCFLEFAKELKKEVEEKTNA